ncbi:glycoside hydrolase, partial [Phaeosphaeriaceae sp. SRC1lsM3a]
CGEFSRGGKTVCPLNACCSRLGFCGTSGVFCRDTLAKAGDGLCLGGSCGAIDAPSCGKSSGTASRRVAYYQSWNSRRRPCDKVLPSQLNLTGITHLVLSFATIDPATFKVGPMNPDDDNIYKQFMALPDNVSKWIGIGGYEFTDSGPTQHTWSDMTASQQNRKAFIDSLKEFCSEWGFKGVDIDWEWPGHESRGGRSGDGANQVQFVKEMREAFGTSFGIGVVIPAQYDYMKNLDPKGLESHVDMMTMLTYDFHGAWDMTIPGLGPKIKPHTDLKEIEESFKLLWSSNIDPEKVNMGIANYGRGYTVADKSCMHYGCTYTGPSKAGSCTRQDGVLSLCEIHRLMDEKHLSSHVIAGGAEVNEITWDDQWISFDDAGTFGKKLELANDRCLGGTALWAIDYATCPGGGDSP